jgi:hypothetical protein
MGIIPKVLILGGTNFLGPHLVHELQQPLLKAPSKPAFSVSLEAKEKQRYLLKSKAGYRKYWNL